MIHFFKAASRLGMINLPYGEKELNLGVEEGPDAVLSQEFLASFSPKPKVTEITFPLPETVDKSSYESALYESLSKMIKAINDNLQAGETQVVIGGDHAVALGSLAAVLGRIPAINVGYIQFDSHGDIHTFESSPSGNFHGMWLRPFLGKFDQPLIESLAPNKLKPEQILYIGNLSLEKEETDFMAEHGVKNLTREDLSQRAKESQAFLEKFVADFPHIHLSFDIDVFDKSLVSATGTPSKAGLFVEDVMPLLEPLARKSDISIDLVEVNPKKEGADKTIKIAREVLTKLLSRGAGN